MGPLPAAARREPRSAGRTMRVALLQDHLRVGGTERQSVQIARLLGEAGHQVRLLVFRPGGALDAVARAAGVDLVHLQPFDLGTDLLAPGLVSAVRRFSPEVVLCMGRVANAYAGWLASRLPDCAVVGSVRTGKALPWSNRWSFRRTRAVLVNSAWWRARLVREGVPDDRVFLVENGLAVDLDAALDAGGAVRDALRDELGAREGCVVALVVAGLRAGKRHQWLLRAMAGVDARREWQLWVVGDGPCLAACRALAERLGIGERVRFLGHQVEPARFYGAADIAVSASVEDAMPNFLVEAQWAARPAVACRVRGVSEVVVDGATGFTVEPDDVGGFRAAVRELVDDPALRARLGDAARVSARERFEPRRQAARLAERLAALRG